MKKNLKRNLSGMASRNGYQKTNPIFGSHQGSWTNDSNNTLYNVKRGPQQSQRQLRLHTNLHLIGIGLIWTVGMLVLGFIIFAILNSIGL